tara:strand:- start:124 stop:480 length:357 start_codon:yes stop_codon:yes gene_type:complete
MKKFSRIVENKEEIITDPVVSLKKVLESLNDSDEESSFIELVCYSIDSEVCDNFSAEFYSIRDESPNGLDLSSFLKLIKKYDIEEEAQNHIYFHLVVLEEFTKKIKPTVHYVKKINEN